MDQQEINKRNEAIADFMGYKYFPWNSPDHQLKGLGGYWAKKNAKIHHPKMNILSTAKNKLRYNYDWNWLADVFITISRTKGCTYIVTPGYCKVVTIHGSFRSTSETTLDACFIAVSDFCLSQQKVNP